MSRQIWSGAGLLAIIVLSAGAFEAAAFEGLFGHRHDSGGCFGCLFGRHKGCHGCQTPDCGPPTGCCQTCELPPTVCTCTTMRPVVETCYKQCQCVSYKNVCETHYRTERCVRKVPVTTYRDVCVDEGCYQMVWVPKMVNKKVPQTCYQDQCYERTVPYTVSRTVPEVTTRMIPERRVRYVPHTTRMVLPGGCGPCATPGCGPACGPGCDQPLPMSPNAGGSLSAPNNPVPDPGTNGESNYEDPMAGVSNGRGSGLFAPAPFAPSAPTAWRARRNIIR